MNLIFSLASILAFSVQKNCDRPGGDQTQKSLATAEECAKSCEEETFCQSWTFISGWNRCFLKNRKGQAVSLKIHTAQIAENAQGSRRIGEKKEDHDDSGKDLRKVAQIKSFEACAEQCVQEQQCVGVAYLEGYRDCWLKKTKGKVRAKVFYCGARSS